MARNARPTAAKREREKALIERRQQKAARRQDNKNKKPSDVSAGDGDPDIAHIKPGPQPLADWQIEEESFGTFEAFGSFEPFETLFERTIRTARTHEPSERLISRETVEQTRAAGGDQVGLAAAARPVC
jgi:IS4 transposase